MKLINECLQSLKTMSEDNVDFSTDLKVENTFDF